MVMLLIAGIAAYKLQSKIPLYVAFGILVLCGILVLIVKIRMNIKSKKNYKYTPQQPQTTIRIPSKSFKYHDDYD